MSSFMFLNMFLDLSSDHLVVVFKTYKGRLDNKCFGDFTCCIIGNRDYSTVGYRGMGKEMGFQFGWCYLETLALVSI